MAATANDIRDAEQNLEQAKRAYLTRFGWEMTCKSPGSYWLWTRDCSDIAKDYGRMTVPMDLAVSMTERTLDQDDDT